MGESEQPNEPPSVLGEATLAARLVEVTDPEDWVEALERLARASAG